MMYESLVRFLNDYNRGVHTNKPAVVTSVDTTKNVLSAKILTKTLFKDGTEETFPDVVDVPYFILSGTKGKSRITIPIDVGDNVIIIFSDRDVGGLMSGKGSSPETPQEIRTHTYEPILAIPCFFTEANAVPVLEPDKIVIENNLTSVKISPTGEVEIIAPTTTTITTPSLVVNCPASVFTGTIAAAGIIPLPGASIIEMEGTWNHTGSFILDGIPMESHRHTHGSTTISTPVP